MAANQVQAMTNALPHPNSLLSVPASATKKQGSSRTDTMSSRSTGPRPKMIVRRLPPGLTQSEFEAIIGKEWQVNGGKVDWAVYKSGKVLKDLSKPSKPSRAYLHLTNPKYVNELAEKVRSTTFNDAASSANDSALLGPPVVEFDPFGRIPGNKTRKDLRQGTIDQDPEFIDFLESLTNPLAKVTTVDQDGENGSKVKEKVTMTPLVQFLKDKKANKGKEAPAASKTPKHSRQDSKDGKSVSNSEKKTPGKVAALSPPDKRSAQAIKVENAARDAVKVLNKQASASKKTPEPITEASMAPASASAPPVSTVNAPSPEKKRERGNASVAARILQRDLGLGGGVRGGRGGRRAVPASPRVAPDKGISPTPPSVAASEPVADTKPTPTVNIPIPATNSSTLPSTSTPESTQITPAQPPAGPSASRNSPKTPSQPRNHISASAQARTPTVSPTATQAFLKHANPSQGITEPLLEEAFTPFGTVSKVEIDKKKGFAYVDFAEPEGLQNAIKASPIKVAQGQVVVLERKTGPTLQARNMRGGPVGPVRGGQQGIVGPRGGAPPAMIANRGGGPPLGPRGGRGGARGRGMVRGGASGHNVGVTKPVQTRRTTSDTAAASAETLEPPPQAPAPATLQES